MQGSFVAILSGIQHDEACLTGDIRTIHSDFEECFKQAGTRDNSEDMNEPSWNPAAKSASIRKWAEHLHRESKCVFLKDKTHAQILFLFKDTGLVSITPVPPNTEHIQIYDAVRRAIKDNNLYAVIHVGEAWSYFIKEGKDHTAFQLMDGEMKVSDLNDADRSECLHLRMESRDGDCVVYLDKIVRDGDKLVLGAGRTVPDEDLKWFEQG
jgi:hypothetical protein